MDGSSPSGVRAMPLKAKQLSMRVVTRISRARWFRFLRRVFEYQNGSRSDLLSNPFNSTQWLALEFFVLVAQIVAITATLVIAGKEKENHPIWPLRIWVAGYNLGNLLSLPLLYWRFCHSNPATDGTDLEQQQRSKQGESRCSYMMNKSRTFLELFFAIWFVMGNVWVFDPRNGSLNHRDPKLHALCILLLAWNAITYSFPFLLFLLLCCCVPSVSKLLGYNMNLASADRGFSDHEISTLAHWRFQQIELANDKSVTQCCICLAKYRDTEEVRQLPCSHIFHQRCIDQWLRIISYCPLCKRELER